LDPNPYTSGYREEAEKEQELNLDNQRHLDIIKDLAAKHVINKNCRTKADITKAAKAREEPRKNTREDNARQAEVIATPRQRVTSRRATGGLLRAGPREWLCRDN